jgi:hypothetical protein
VLQRAGRQIFNLAELAQIMTAMADNKCKNSGCMIDDRRIYDFKRLGPAQAALRRLTRVGDKIASFKSGSMRLPTVYGFLSVGSRVDELIVANRSEIMEALERDRDCNPLSDEHPISIFAGPVKTCSRSS